MSGTVLIEHTQTVTLPKSDNPIVGTFTSAKSMVSINAIEPGENGARLDVYDAVTGGNLIGSAECVIEQCAPESGSNGTGAFDTLAVQVPGIRRFELYQPRSTADNFDGVQWDNLRFEPLCACERFTTSDFGRPMGKKKKFGSIIPVRFRLFFDDNEITSQEQLDSALNESGCAASCPKILIVDITDGDGGVDLPEDLDDSATDADDSDCFQYADGNWILKLRLGSQFQAGRTYRVEVQLSDCVLTPQNNTFQTK
jgi:hypothetical protein